MAKKKALIQFIMVIGLISLIPLFYFVVPTYLPAPAPTDIDKIREGQYNGNYLVTDGRGSVAIMDLVTNTLLWETKEPVFFVHDATMMPGGESILVTDTAIDRVFEMNISNKVILWEWYGLNQTTREFTSYNNWTQFGLANGWSAEGLAFVDDRDSTTHYYTHVNKVQFLNGSDFGRSYDTILMSLRNFDMIIEVNYTAQEGESGYMNITWHYGKSMEHSTLHHPHAPKRWPNGHTTICDAENDRIFEINETNQVVWEFTNQKLRWPRDCELLPNGNYLITDSCNNRIIEVNITANHIVKTFTDVFLAVPYEADYNPEDNQVVVGSNQITIIFDYTTGRLVRRVGFPWFSAPILIMITIVITYISITMGLQIREMKEKSILNRFKSQKIYSKLLTIGILSMFMYFLNFVVGFFYYFVMS